MGGPVLAARPARRSAPWLAALITLAGCADYSQLAYRQDKKVEFLSPPARRLVAVPVTLRWRDSHSAPPASYAVFIDKAPVKAGHTLKDLAGKDAACKRNPACPDPQYLADRGVYVTTVPELTLTSVAPLTSKEKVQLHEAVVILLDSDGRRIGESGWRLEFKLKKRQFG